jgi:hypothetical protein
MHVAGRPSWRLTHELDGQWPHVVLYVRDALGLVPDNAPAIPPPLSGTIPDHSALLDRGERDRATHEWAGWWTQTLDSEQRMQCWSREPNRPKAFHEVVEEAGRTVAPSTAPALADTALQPVAQRLFDEGSRWINDVRLAAPRPRPDSPRGFDSNLTRETVAAVADELGVAVHLLDGTVSILNVEGLWWEVTDPGFAVCSLAASEDPAAAREALRAVFASSVRV